MVVDGLIGAALWRKSAGTKARPLQVRAGSGFAFCSGRLLRRTGFGVGA
jgi:hypothetical protein